MNNEIYRNESKDKSILGSFLTRKQLGELGGISAISVLSSGIYLSLTNSEIFTSVIATFAGTITVKAIDSLVEVIKNERRLNKTLDSEKKPYSYSNIRPLSSVNNQVLEDYYWEATIDVKKEIGNRNFSFTRKNNQEQDEENEQLDTNLLKNVNRAIRNRVLYSIIEKLPAENKKIEETKKILDNNYQIIDEKIRWMVGNMPYYGEDIFYLVVNDNEKDGVNALMTKISDFSESIVPSNIDFTQRRVTKLLKWLEINEEN